jgi:hypothetical protein
MLRRIVTLVIACAMALLTVPAFSQGKGKGAEKREEAREKQAKRKGNKGKSKRVEKAQKGKPGKGKGAENGKGEKAGKAKGKPEKAGKGEEAGEPSTQPSGAKAKQRTQERKKHLQRLAKIDRIAEIGAEEKNENLVEKAKMLREKETKRHRRALKRIEEGNLGKGKANGAEKKKGADETDREEGEE